MLSLDLDIYQLHLWFNDEVISLTLPTWIIAVGVGVIVFRKVKRGRR
ncbi:hypothetical protein UFOVP1119_64 [uncultured Caudovirales phage]|jgi:hypothetical protein|uniref:Uncharacterized protein n=1 Tax=uncultured Caudovirales phage TaxID=2100421 RepID=A0A6J5R1G4_9CAUD|nr:hypothetical protein UFOVP1119_64 [uncultured Caudovirales phage]CAB4193224.1 hypothetical protein UFOVP1238_38 [uncultured Caudovirales phage]